MASSFARLRHEFAQCVGDAIAWRVGVKGAHEFAFRVHDVKIGTVVHDVVFGARSSLMGCPVGPLFYSLATAAICCGFPVSPTIRGSNDWVYCSSTSRVSRCGSTVMKSGRILAASVPSFSSAVAISFSVIGQVLGQKVYPK